MKLTLIAAMAEQRVIGVNNTLPWKLSADLKRFKALTTNHTILMGRKTFESLGRPLPSRIHVCVSRAYPVDRLTPDPRWPEQVFWCGELHAAVRILRQKNSTTPETNVFIIGGAEIYAQALAIADSLELTRIHATYTGDAFFPHFENLFRCESETHGEESGLKYTFARYESLRPAGFNVRTAASADADFIAQSQIKMAAESENLNLRPDVVAAGVTYILANPSIGEYLIAEQTDLAGNCQPAGCLLLQKEWSDWRNGNVEWIHSVFVEKHFRGNGIFRWMYAVATARARTRGSLGLRLYVDKTNLAAQTVYTKLGMRNDHYELFEDLFQ
ncbi:MAG: hypothetical protein RLZZ488_1392 [Pseudomonadota bacterium]|jgi:dihydrofolate reductase